MAKSRKSRTRNWVNRQSRDPFVQKARASGYASRAAFKLEDIDTRDRLLSPGMTVIDLGAAPGSWSQYALGRVTSRGRIIAVDRAAPSVTGVVSICGDIRSEETHQQIVEALGGSLADLVMSDMAPDISGVRDTDEARFEELLIAIESVIDTGLKPGGKLLVKLFQGPVADDFRERMRRRFDRVSARKPASSRSQSREYFLSASGFIAPTKTCP